MNTKDVALMKAVAVVVREYVGQAWSDVTARLKALEAQPAPRDGKDGAPGEKGRDGAPGRDGLNGKDGAPGLSGKDGVPGPPGKDGASGLNGKDGAPGLNGKDGAPGEKGLDGSPGRDGRDGQQGLPGLQGDKGADGLNGKDGMDGTNGKDGSHGLNGKDGADGLGFDDLDVRFDETRGWLLRFVRGDQTKEFPMPIPWDAGVWQSGRVYPKGAGVTQQGSLWIAQEATSARPGDAGSASRAWRLAVKRGTDGKPGPPGRDGADG